MDKQSNVSQVLESVSRPDIGSDDLIRQGEFAVRELTLTVEKVARLWDIVSHFRTLFSDLTKGDIDNFLRFITKGHSMWMEIYKSGEMTGVVCFTNMHKIIEADAHIIFFDRKLADKTAICKQLVAWMFDSFPIQRINVEIPRFYYATIRLVKDIGFINEGEKRKAVLINGRWANVYYFGMTRADMEATCRS